MGLRSLIGLLLQQFKQQTILVAARPFELREFFQVEQKGVLKDFDLAFGEFECHGYFFQTRMLSSSCRRIIIVRVSPLDL